MGGEAVLGGALLLFLYCPLSFLLVFFVVLAVSHLSPPGGHESETTAHRCGSTKNGAGERRKETADKLLEELIWVVPRAER